MKVSEVQGCARVRSSVPGNQLVALLLAHRDDTGAGIRTLDRRGEPAELSYAQLFEQASRLCAGLQQAALRPGERVVLQLGDPLTVLVGFWGCILAGVVPVPLNTAPFYHRPCSQSDRLLQVLQRFGCRAVLASADLVAPLQGLLASSAVTVPVLDIDACCAVSRAPVLHTPAPSDAAAMFLTSGSTGAAKGVVQSHAAMLAMADATIQMNGFHAGDVTLNWMSMDHAGSLVFLGVLPLALGATQVHVPIDYVLKDPTRWLDLIERYRASITWAPNFVFALLLDREQQLLKRQWDLSSMRFMVNAGEAVVSASARRFIRLLQNFGLPEAALRPAFGMVETCSGITWSSGFRLQDTADTDSFVALGTVIPGAAMKIVDDSDRTLPEGQEGRLLLQGESVFKGYEDEPELNAQLLRDGWFATGDLAFIRDGALYVTGREKDIVIINGNNHYCHELEALVARAPQVASDCVAATGVRLAGANTESLVIFYALAPAADGAAPELAAADRAALEKVWRADLAQASGIAVHAFVALQPGEFPRTEIGKIKRSLLRQRYEAGDFGATTAEAGSAGLRTAQPLQSGASRELLASITQIWQRVLRLDAIGLDDTFFELGGSSLLAIQVQHELELLLGRTVSMVELFDTPTIRSMAAHFSGDSAAAPAPAAALPGAGREAQGGDIAVIGIGCRFPGAHGPEAFWKVLQDGVETISFFTPEQAMAAGLSAQRAHDPAQVNAAPVLDDIEGCDLDFWNYARREAELLDPQQRVFLETAWEAFEDAGYVPGSALGRVGVYASAATNTYLQNNVYANRDWVAANGGALLTVNSLDGFNVMVANDKDYLPTRVSYKLDLIGPSMSIQTACSSTLVAVHEAVRALRSGECDMALAGGCALMLPQHAGHYYDEGMINSPDGHCRAYDSAARGTIFGSGSGAVLLKRLDRALADGDAIYAVIKGSAVANDGGQKMGFAAPSLLGEYRAIAGAIADAGVDADSIGFIEGHGTGTPIGDPIEVQALTRAFRHSTTRTGYCALGSVKTNIGHMGIASGIAGFIKAVLALQQRSIPGTVHFREANPAMDIERTPFYVTSATRPWPADGQPRRAGVNSLGIGGTNVHVILEEAPAAASADVPAEGVQAESLQAESVQTESAQAESVQVLPLSARTAAALQQRIAALADCLRRQPQLSLADLGFTLQQGRAAMASRFACVASSRDELLAQLDAAAALPASALPAQPAAKVVFLFTGQGSQYAGMGRQLYATQPVFRAALDEVTALFATQRPASVLGLLLAEPDDTAAAALLNQTQYTQPALFCLQVALVKLYRSCGIEPELIVGHSIGEVAAVWAAGGLSLADAARLVELRSRLMQALPGTGGMAATQAAADTVRALLADAGIDCEIAACNGPLDTTLTGEHAPLAEACALLQRHGIRTTPLNVSHAFHSRQLDAMQQAFAAGIAALEFRTPALPVFANVDAAALDAQRHTAGYWTTQLRAPVLFMQGLQQALAAGGRCCVEIGPAPVLCSLGRSLDTGAENSALHWLPSLRKGHADAQVFAQALASLFALGHDIDWSALPPGKGRRVHLPGYPWQRQRCWIEPDAVAAPQPSGDPLLAPPLLLPRQGQHIYRLDYSPQAIPVLTQHRVFGAVVPPAALYVSQLLHTAAQVGGHRQLRLADIEFVAPLHIPESGTGESGAGDSAADARRVEVQIVYTRSAGVTAIELCSQPASTALQQLAAADVQVHVRAELQSADAGSVPLRVDLDAIRQRCRETVDPQTIEAHMRAMQVELGESFRCFRSIQRGNAEALALLELPTGSAARIAQGIPAGLIDCHWQTILAALPALPASTVVPARIEALYSPGEPLPARLWAHAQLQQQSAAGISATVRLFADSGELLLETRGIELRRVDVRIFRPVQATLQPQLYARRWDALALPAATDATPAGGRVLVAGAEPEVNALVAQLRAHGSDALALTAVTQLPTLLEGGTPCSLLYVDPIDTAEAAANAAPALNRVLATLEPLAAALRQVLVLTTLSAPDSLPQLVASRAALAAQAVSAAQELPALCIRVVEMDEDARNLQVLAALLARPGDSGRRLRLHCGELSAPVALPLQPGTAQISFAAQQLQVITGGLGGLGLLTARWMLQRGARRLLLVARSAPSAQASAVLAELRAQGADIVVQHCDVSQREQVQALVAVAAGMGPVETLVYAAGGRRDGLITSLQDDDFTALARVKAGGAITLHEALAELTPQRTVYYSSVAGWLGAAAQSNYAAANAALDALALHYSHAAAARASARAAGSVISVAWGPFSRAGMTAQLSEAQLERISGNGYGFLEAEAAFSLLGRQLAAGGPAEICILAADTQRLAQLPGAAGYWSAPAPRAIPAQQPDASTALPALAARLRSLDAVAAREHLQDHLVALVGELTRGTRTAPVDFDAGFLDLGLDSLAALELRRQLEAALGLKLKSTIILDYPRIADMARALAELARAAHGSTAAPSRADLLRQLASEIDFEEQA